MKTVIFDKDRGTTAGVVNLTLDSGEAIGTVDVLPVTPVVSGGIPLTATLTSTNPITLTFDGGDEGIAYKVPLVITTTKKTLSISVVVNVRSTTPYPYGVDPESCSDLLDTIRQGESALGVARFQFPPGVETVGGFVVWEILDSHGRILNSGNAYDIKFSDSGLAVLVEASCIVSVPSDTQVSDDKYQLRYTLQIDESKFYLFEQLHVIGFLDIPLGAQSAVEVMGDPANLTLVTEKAYRNYRIEVYNNTKAIGSMNVANPVKVGHGYMVDAIVDTQSLPVSLLPYAVLWKMWDTPNSVFRDTSQLWVINDSISLAVEDIKAKINKAQQTLYGVHDSQFPVIEIIRWLRRAGDAFNGAYGQFTNFTFTNAQGVIREMWLLLAEKFALESQYLLEAEKSFNFSGAAISLDVDKTSYIDSALGRINQVLDSELKPLKQNLIIKGATGGDGSIGPSGIPGSVGRKNTHAVVGLSINAASMYNGGLASGSGGRSIFLSR